MIIGGFVSFILLLWMILRIWKESTLLAIVSLFFWPALVYAVVKNWGDEESDIKVPFFFFMYFQRTADSVVSPLPPACTAKSGPFIPSTA